MWTTENTLVALGYLALIGSLFSLVLYLERRTKLLATVDEVKKRLTELPYYETTVQLDTDGSLSKLRSRSRLVIGSIVGSDGDGMVRHIATREAHLMIGIVVAQEPEPKYAR